MSVIINDFEIVTDSSGDQDAGDGESAPDAEPPSSMRPIDVMKIQDRNERRRRRLRAH